MLILTSYAESLRIVKVYFRVEFFPVKRSGTTFHTPISTGSRLLRPGVEDIIEDLCSKIVNDDQQCRGTTDTFRGMIDSPNFILSLACVRVPRSYRYIKRSLRGENCKEVFCRQLSDLLVFCKDCKIRPMEHIVTKDEAAMKEHLGNHRVETDQHRTLYKRLMSTID